MAHNSQLNNWQILHKHLTDKKNKAGMQVTMALCGFSERTFYRKMTNTSELTEAEIEAICKAYDIPRELLFPEIENPVLIRQGE